MRRRGLIGSDGFAWLVLGGVVLLWLVSVWRLSGVLDGLGMGDFQVYVRGSRDWLAGSDAYATDARLPYTYPPSALLLLAPFSVLPLSIGKVVLTWCGILAMTLVTTVVAWRMSRRAQTMTTGSADPNGHTDWDLEGASNGSWRWQWPVAIGVGVAAISFWWEPVWANFRLGQVNILLMAAVVVDLFLIPRKWRGGLLGLAIAVKLTPAVFLVYLVWSRQFRAAAISLGMAAFWFVAAWLLGAGSIASYVSTIAGDDRQGSFKYARKMNQSLNGLVNRTFESELLQVLGWVALSTAGLLIVALVLYRLRPAVDDGLAFSVVAFLGLLVTPISWTHHYVWLAPIVVVAGYVYRSRSLFTAVVFAMAVLMTYGRIISPPKGAERSPEFSVWLWNNAYVWLALLAVVAAAIPTARLWSQNPRQSETNAPGRVG